jgi:hypothetical protein
MLDSSTTFILIRQALQPATHSIGWRFSEQNTLPHFHHDRFIILSNSICDLA